MDCLFCQIANQKIPADIIYQDEHIVCFSDIHPQAPLHKIIIPRQHIATLNDLTIKDSATTAHMIQSASDIAKKLGIADDGYRVVINCNGAGGQTVFHIHMHLIGGRTMTWPPG